MSMNENAEFQGLDTFEVEAGLIAEALVEAAKQPHGFTVDDVDRLEAFWSYLGRDYSSVGCIATLSDGRRFEISYNPGQEPEDEPEEKPPTLEVRQMATTEGFSASQQPPWVDDVSELNEYLGLPADPNARAAALVTRY